MAEQNPMRKIEVSKVTLNVGSGGPGSRLDRAETLLEELTGREPKRTNAQGRTGFGVTQGRDIGVMVTLRDQDAVEFLDKIFEAKDYQINASNFDDSGNLSIGIKEHINIPGTEYDPDIGILGFDVIVTLERPGFRVKKRNISKPIGDNHKIDKSEAIEFIEEEFDVDVVGDY